MKTDCNVGISFNVSENNCNNDARINEADNQQFGRKVISRNVRVTPDFRKEPDIEKLGEVFMALAKTLAEKKSRKKSKTK